MTCGLEIQSGKYFELFHLHGNFTNILSQKHQFFEAATFASSSLLLIVSVLLFEVSWMLTVCKDNSNRPILSTQTQHIHPFNLTHYSLELLREVIIDIVVIPILDPE